MADFLRRGALIALLALAVVPGTAAAEGFEITFRQEGDVRVKRFQDCPGTECAPSLISIQLVRDGTLLAETRQEDWPRIVSPETYGLMREGDVVRILRDGVVRVTVPFEGWPKADVDCFPADASVVTGTLRSGPPRGLSGGVPAGDPEDHVVRPDPYTYLLVRALTPSTAIALPSSVSGDTWSVTPPGPPWKGTGLELTNSFVVPTPVGVARITSVRYLPRCLPGQPAHWAPCSAETLRASGTFARSAAKAVRHLRRHARRFFRGWPPLGVIEGCPQPDGRLEALIRLRGKRGGVIASMTWPTYGRGAIASPRRTAFGRRQRTRRRLPLVVRFTYTDPDGGRISHVARVTLRPRGR